MFIDAINKNLRQTIGRMITIFELNFEVWNEKYNPFTINESHSRMLSEIALWIFDCNVKTLNFWYWNTFFYVNEAYANKIC